LVSLETLASAAPDCTALCIPDELGLKLAGGAPIARVHHPGVQLSFAGSKLGASLDGVAELPGRANHLIGNRPNLWHREIPRYSQVHFRNRFRTIHLSFSAVAAQVELDPRIAPGADPRAPRFDIDGAMLRK
jgi:hypothetical protein